MCCLKTERAIAKLTSVHGPSKYLVSNRTSIGGLPPLSIFRCWVDINMEWLICCLASKWYQFVRNDDVWRLTKQPKLTAIIQSRRLTLFGHIMHMDDNADAKRILLASPPADWRRQLGRLRITWLSTVQQDLKNHRFTLPEAADLAQNRPLWRMMSMYGATQS